LRIVQALAGHTSYKMTERYAHLSPEVRGKAVRVLDRLGDGALGGTPLH
jgi:integrase